MRRILKARWLSVIAGTSRRLNHVGALATLCLVLALQAGFSSAFAISPASTSSTGFVSAGLNHTCAMMGTYNSRVKCWGRNEYGQIGDGTTLDGPVEPTEVANLSGVSMVAAGGYHTCALIASNGSIKCWGYNAYGQLGNNSTMSISTPAQVVDGFNNPVTGAVVITAGLYHTCAAFADGNAQCWGQNANGQLGDGSLDDSSTPLNVSGFLSDVTSISAGELHTCLVRSSTNIVQCFGNNSHGALGQTTGGDNQTTPGTVSGISNAVDVTCGAGLSCAHLSTGGLKCWGANSKGAVGDGTTTNANLPVLVGAIGSDTNAVEVGGSAFNANHSCAILDSTREVVCWGDGAQGQIGDSNNTQRNTPTLVSSLSDAQDITTGGSHTCAFTLPCGVTCWGNNTYGQLGDGTTTSSNVPVHVFTCNSGTPTPTPTPSATPDACSSETSCRPDGSLTTPLNPRSPDFTVSPQKTPGAAVAITSKEVKLGVPVSPARRALLKSRLQKFLGQKISNLAKTIKTLQVFYLFNITRVPVKSAWEFEEPDDFETLGGLPTRLKQESRKRRVTARLAPGYYSATVAVRIKDSRGRIFTTGKPSAPISFRVR